MSRGEFRRSQRVAELLREELSRMISSELKDPLVTMATVTAIRLTEDLRFAKVYVSILGNEKEQKNCLRGLERAKNHLRSELGGRLRLRHVPELSFFRDDTVDYAHNIEELLNRIHDEHD
ncbi:MAG: 30S ribosome-binding factor RbfA [Calditrichaeota bacterium]|nr:MAG: 30S ribosome-binding factor RbfA [Calditrichota bacterium]